MRKKQDKADEVTQQLRNILEQARSDAMLLSREQLFKGNNNNANIWYKTQTANFNNFSISVKRLLSGRLKKAKKSIKTNAIGVVTDKQIVQLNSFIENGMILLGTQVIKQHKTNTNDIIKQYRSKKTPILFNEIKKVFDARPNGNYINVTYKNGRTYKWESYMEMLVRTEIQSEISENMLTEGHELGNVFYICNYYGDCAKDHVDYQGRIYVDKNWDELVSDQNIKDQINAYIVANNVLSVQDVKDNAPYLTTRPNCRHYFQYISVDEVLNITSKDKLNAELKDRNMVANGAYSPEKYKALQEQRFNERNIRKYKEELEQAQVNYNNMPANISQQEKNQIIANLNNAKSNIRFFQNKQRELINDNSNLRRDYKREKPKDIYNLGAKKK